MGTVQLNQMSNSFAYSCQTRSAVGGAKFQWIGEKTNSSGSSKLGQPIRSSIDQFPTLDSKKIKISNDLWGQKLGDFERKKIPSLTERCHHSPVNPNPNQADLHEIQMCMIRGNNFGQFTVNWSDCSMHSFHVVGETAKRFVTIPLASWYVTLKS